ncbi:uncharacterized protein LOC141907720 [Tubulanus polymorphus]|uniref:uncharacterized protein LOC141907720 n=1 Tax=Tubulanus polymorphus TaxID=672921 RepID=UPI003DA4C832
MSSYSSQRYCFDGAVSGRYCETRREHNPWIIVDLGAKHVVQAVDLYYSTRYSNGYCSSYRRGLKWSLLQSRVGDGNDLHNPICTNFTDVVYGCGNHVFKQCDESLIGRFVSVQIMAYERLKLAEIVVIGFKYIDPNECTYPGSIGCMTEAQCNINVPNRVDYLTGYCHGGCNANYIGKYCDKGQSCVTLCARIRTSLLELEVQIQINGCLCSGIALMAKDREGMVDDRNLLKF